MESANHQHQEQLGGSSSFAVPSLNGAGTNHLWSQNLLLNSSGNFNSNVNGSLSNSRDLRHNSDTLVHPSICTSMFQDLGFQWPANADNYTNHFPQELHAAKIKEELSDSFSRYSDLTNLDDHLQLPSTSYIKHDHQFLQDLNEKLLVKNFYSGCQINGSYLSAGDFFANHHITASMGNASTYGRGNLSRILPSTNISSLNPSSPTFSGTLGMNLQALDLLSPRKFGVNFSQPSHSCFPSLKASVPFGLDHLQESSQGLSNNSQKISFTNGATETKRVNANSELKPSQAAPKKPRIESRSSFPPFKVRKEKLGDRIAALQQLVAPFGKTDTASVLMEAIGYIKFLQDQVETLSVPYMKSSGNGARRPAQGGSGVQDNKDEPKRDLRSRGLCLVPLSCTAYVTNDNGGMWSPPNFTGGS